MAPSQPHRASYVLLAFLLIACEFLLPTAASPLTPNTLASNNIFRRANATAVPDPINCTTKFSTDYYGFGVRLGVYFAWLGAYFSNTMLPSEISGSLDTNSIFLLALLISLFKGSLKHEIYQIDGLIVMHLSSGFLFSSLSIWGYRTTHYQRKRDSVRGINHFGNFGTHGRLVLITAISIYGAWFWWEGIEDGLIIAELPECQKLYTWFFAKCAVDGGIDKYYIFVTVACSVYYGTMCLVAVIALLAKLLRVGWKGMLQYETGLNARELEILFNFLRVGNLVWIVFCASMIEMTLNENNMLDTLSQNGNIAFPAQLLPLLIGSLSFARVLWLIYVQRREKRKAATADGGAVVQSSTPAAPTIENTVITPTPRSFRGYKVLLPWGQSSSPPPVEEEVLEPDSPQRPHPHYVRYLVALYPWLSTFDFWTKPARRTGDVEESSPGSAVTDEKSGGIAVRDSMAKRQD